MMLVDTHAHIHFGEYDKELDEIFERARTADVTQIITVGTESDDSKLALDFIQAHKPKGIKLYSTIGLHPHEAGRGDEVLNSIKELIAENQAKIVAVGECGLDYYRNLSSHEDQEKALRFQIQGALKHGLPLIFHVRDAWEDFFNIIRDYDGIQGVIHSFTGGPDEVSKAGEFGLYFGLNGIMTFTKDDNQLTAAKQIPTDRLLLETDCPYLAPMPHRGKRNEPSYLRDTVEFLAQLRGVSFDELAKQTTDNAKALFGF